MIAEHPGVVALRYLALHTPWLSEAGCGAPDERPLCEPTTSSLPPVELVSWCLLNFTSNPRQAPRGPADPRAAPRLAVGGPPGCPRDRARLRAMVLLHSNCYNSIYSYYICLFVHTRDVQVRPVACATAQARGARALGHACIRACVECADVCLCARVHSR